MTMTKEKFTYIPQGVCSKRFDFELEGDVITNVTITGGCPGNFQNHQGENCKRSSRCFSGSSLRREADILS